MRLKLSGIAKRFGGFQALAGVDLELHGGEIHALLGENGAGKSTLMNVLYGLLQPDGGEIALDDRPLRPRSPAEARALGIGMVHQHFTVVDALTTAENFALSLPGLGLRLRRDDLARRALELAQRFGLDIGDPNAASGSLSVGARQRIEILKALAGDARILILDEPTAVLTPVEVAQLFGVLSTLRAEGRLVILITHKLQEVREIADRVSVLRRGRIAGGGTPTELGDRDLANLMVGSAAAPPNALPRPPGEGQGGGASSTQPAAATQPLLRFDGVSLDAEAPPFDLAVCAGEVLGFVGVDGNGQTELFEILAGLRRPRSGSVAFAAAEIATVSPAAMQHAGIAVIPPDRRADGLVAEMSVRENLVLARVLLRRFSRHGVLQRKRIDVFTAAQARRYNVRASALEVEAGALSGGNQQRIVVARALAAEPRILVAVNPTRGLDIAAAAAVYEALNAFVAAGNAVILVSTDLDEVMEMSHRIGVLFRHRISPLLEPPFSLEQIGLLMAGAA